MARKLLKCVPIAVLILMTVSCSVYKHVPDGEYLLNRVSVNVDGYEKEKANVSKYRSMSYQTPNRKWFGLFRIPLRVYSISGKGSADSDRRNLFRRIGEEPVILDTALCNASVSNIRKALFNKGYLKAAVDKHIAYHRRPEADVIYTLHPGTQYLVADYSMEIADKALDSLLRHPEVVSASLINPEMPLDADVLESERTRIVSLLQTRGYYSFSKENISFVADTTNGSEMVSLTMHIRPYGTSGTDSIIRYPVYTLDSVRYVLGGSPSNGGIDLSGYVRVDLGDGACYYYSSDGLFKLKPKILRSHTFLSRGRLYNSNVVSRTYSSLGRLSAVKYSNITFDENREEQTVNANVLLTPNQKYSFSAEVEGTNTAGDFGVAAALLFTDRNVFGGSEQLSLKLRGAFEAISNLPGYSGNSYKEYGIEANLDFPELLLPFVSPEFQRRSQAVSQLSLMLNSQRRPEFDKLIFTSGWSYIWSSRRYTQRFDVLDVNYLTVPWISEKFKHEYLDSIDSRRSILRHNYEDLLITRMGYSFYYSNAAISSTNPLNFSLRINAESSGNLLYGIYRLANLPVNSDGQYQFLGIAFAQYFRSDGSFTMNRKLDDWNNILFHVEYGVALPYSNSTAVPFEKRFYAGGANSVRGWAVRELGPGSYRNNGGFVNYITQAGDVKLGASVELRSRLFWKLNFALFADAGNIWTIREYDEQPDGVFKFDRFYRQIGVSCGCGVRLDLNFLVVRIDYGKQIVNPAYADNTAERYPLFNKVDYRSSAFHFAIGYPF